MSVIWGYQTASERADEVLPLIHVAAAEDTVMGESVRICSPTPFDVMAIYALYQTMG